MSSPHTPTDVPLRRTWLGVNGVALHVVETGPADGPPVVLLHGFPEAWFGWRAQIAALAAAGYRVITPDQRGYNLSAKPSGVCAYQVGELVRDVLGLLDARGLQRARVVGHDWGAAVAWALALQYPERVQQLVIMNVPHPAAMQLALTRRAAQRRRSWYMLAFQVPALPEWLLRQRGARALAQALVRTSRPHTFDAELDAYRDAWLQPGALTGMINWYRALRHAGAGARDAASLRVRVPTLILWGVQDHFLIPELAEDSLTYCDDARLVRFETATHWLHHEQPDDVNAQLIGFFRGV